MTRVAINGLGRIGRALVKILYETDDFELIAVNEIAAADNIAYLLKHDSVYGNYERHVESKDGELIVGDETYSYLNEKEPGNLPWAEMNIDIVFECTGIFRTKDQISPHIDAGADRVILSAPAKSDDIDMVVHGVNSPENGNARIISCASCTTNCISPVMEIADRTLGVEKATMTTIHAYTSSQNIVDGPHSKYRRGRSGAVNFVPTSTGAAIATQKALPSLKGKFDGVAVRGPIPVGSVADIVFVASEATSAEEINDIFWGESHTDRYDKVLDVAEDPVVSSDIVQDPHASIFDPSMTQVVGGDLVKVMAWYDNEWGFTNQMVREARNMMRNEVKA